MTSLETLAKAGLESDEIPFEELQRVYFSLQTKALDYIDQNVPDEPEDFSEIRSFATGVKLAPKNTAESAQYLRNLSESGTSRYLRRCLQVQRESRGLPAVYPTAYSASQAVPKSERVLKVSDLRRGMKAFSYDPRIPGTAGHIFEITGRLKNGTIITCSNDVKAPGEIDYVPFSFYAEHWSQTFQFGSTNLNGYDFADFNGPPKPAHPGGLGDRYLQSIDDLRKIRRQKFRKYGVDHYLVRMLDRDIARMEAHYKRAS